MYEETNETVVIKCGIKKYHYFCGFFEDATAKIVFFTLSHLLNVINCLLFYGIIWYERFGTGHRRTLLNKIVSLICWCQFHQHHTRKFFVQKCFVQLFFSYKAKR